MQVRELPALKDIRSYVASQLKDEIWDEEQRFENPHVHFLDMTPRYFKMKQDVLEGMRQKVAQIVDSLGK